MSDDSCGVVYGEHALGKKVGVQQDITFAYEREAAIVLNGIGTLDNDIALHVDHTCYGQVTCRIHGY